MAARFALCTMLGTSSATDGNYSASFMAASCGLSFSSMPQAHSSIDGIGVGGASFVAAYLAFFWG